MAGSHSVVVANCRLWLCYRFWWWWNEEAAEAVRYKKIKYGKWKKENTEEAVVVARNAYIRNIVV